MNYKIIFNFKQNKIFKVNKIIVRNNKIYNIFLMMINFYKEF